MPVRFPYYWPALYFGPSLVLSLFGGCKDDITALFSFIQLAVDVSFQVILEVSERRRSLREHLVEREQDEVMRARGRKLSEVNPSLLAADALTFYIFQHPECKKVHLKVTRTKATN